MADRSRTAARGLLGGLLLASSVLWAATGAAPASTGVERPAPAADSMCAEVIVYVVRGSGESPQPGPATNGDTWDAFDPIDPETGGSSIDADRVLDVDESGKPTVDTKTPFLYDLVQKVHERVGGQLRLSWSPVKYRAVPVSKFDAGFALWLVHGYPASVTSGIRELHRTLKRQWELCGDRTRYVLAGYSQGADVVNSYLRGKIVTSSSTFGIATVHEYLGPSEDVRRQIASVALIADPNHDPRDPESYSDEDGRLAQEGGLYGIRAGVPRDIAGVTDSLCLAGDSVCGRGVRVPDSTGNKIHSVGYRDFVRHPVECHLADEPDDDVSATTCLADRIVERLGVRNLVRHPLDEADSAPGSSGRDVAFFIDTTGSMQDDIDAALSFAANQADRIVALDGRVALVQYRDAEDDTPAEVVTPFTTDMGEFQSGLSTLLADGGGDDPEGLLHALMVGFDELDWQYGATKAAVVLTDADFHEPDLTGGETLPQVERRSLEIDPVNVFPVVGGDVGRYDDLAARTSGEVISNDGGDTELALGLALDNIAGRPIAVLSNGTYHASPGREVHFDASGSTASSSLIEEYRWDLDGDGFTDEVTSEPTLNHAYPAGYSGLMQVFVVDDLGRSANASAAVLVDDEAPVTVAPVVPTATRMDADARRDDDHVVLDVSWSPGAEDPERWVVALDGDPVVTASGGAHHATVPVDEQEAPWTVSLVPMDADGNYGASFEAELGPVTAGRPWYRRPEVWVAAALAGVLGALGPWLLLRRRRRAA
jgi:Mg-chelatase subunit ChlD